MKAKDKNYITPKGLARLQDEYDFLKKVERPKVCDLVSWAASLGDRSENADYLYGKKRLREIDRRMRFLSHRISCAVVINPVNREMSQIQFGATVELENDQGKREKFSIVGVDEIDGHYGKISWKSPLGKSLLGKDVGDVIVVQAPKGEKEYEIISFVYEDIFTKEFTIED